MCQFSASNMKNKEHLMSFFVLHRRFVQYTLDCTFKLDKFRTKDKTLHSWHCLDIIVANSNLH